MRLQAWLWRQGYRSESKDENWGDLQKKKKKGQRLLGCTIFRHLGLKMTQIVELTGDDFFFFFFWRSPQFSSLVLDLQHCLDNQACNRISPSRFWKKNVEGAINFVSWKFVIQCPDFCFSKYGNPNNDASRLLQRKRWVIVIRHFTSNTAEFDLD